MGNSGGIKYLVSPNLILAADATYVFSEENSQLKWTNMQLCSKIAFSKVEKRSMA